MKIQDIRFSCPTCQVKHQLILCFKSKIFLVPGLTDRTSQNRSAKQTKNKIHKFFSFLDFKPDPFIDFNPNTTCVTSAFFKTEKGPHMGRIVLDEKDPVLPCYSVWNVWIDIPGGVFGIRDKGKKFLQRENFLFFSFRIQLLVHLSGKWPKWKAVDCKARPRYLECKFQGLSTGRQT